MNQNNVIRTKMASALLSAVAACAGKRSAGKIGAMVIKANARGAGVKWAPRSQQKQKVAA